MVPPGCPLQPDLSYNPDQIRGQIITEKALAVSEDRLSLAAAEFDGGGRPTRRCGAELSLWSLWA